MSEKRGREAGGGGSGTRANGRQKKHKIKVMDQSKQTPEERRLLRLEQRSLRARVIEQELDIADPTKNNMQEVTKENHALFERTKFPREAVQDGETLKLIAKAAAEQVKIVSNNAAGINVEELLNRIRSAFGDKDDGGQFGWSRFGRKVSAVFLSVPQGGGFMMGPLDKAAKGPRANNRGKRKPTDDDAPEITPQTQEAEQGKKGAKQNLDQTQRRISKMRAHEEVKGSVGTRQDMFETLVNPRSFTQTVENLFDFSFFVKNSKGSIFVDEKTELPQVSFEDQAGGQTTGNHAPAPKQWLLSITPAHFREIQELYDMTESNIPHRDEGKKSDYYDPLVHGTRESHRQ